MKISIHNKKDEAHNGHWGKEKYGNLYKTIAKAENRDELGEECWLDFPHDAFKLWPRASGEHRCRYPHHIIEDGDTMIVSVPGVKAAYSRAKQQGVFSGKIKEHLERHYRELELYEGSTMDTDNKIEENFQFIESYVVESSSRNKSLRPDTTDWRSPTDVFNWVRSNISYDKTIHGWKLRDVEKTIKDRKGNCHDQSYLVSDLLEALDYKTSQLFFIEYNRGDTTGGNAHTLTYYTVKSKIYWMETAWEDQAKIHGPYNSLYSLKKDIHKIWKEDNDINSGKYSDIAFATKSGYQIGMSLGEYVESWQTLTESDDLESPPELEDLPTEPQADLTEEVPEKPQSLPKQTDAAESDKNGVRRKQLYIEFIEYAKRIRVKNTFGSMFDKDGFNVTYPFVPDDMRYFYRLANPLLCVLENNLTFFALSELRKVNTGNDYKKLIVFAATTELVYFRLTDKKIYSSPEDIKTLITDDTKLASATPLADSFDQYIEQLVGKQILNS